MGKLASSHFAQNAFFNAVRVRRVFSGWRLLEKILAKLSLIDAIEKHKINCVIDVGANRGTFGIHIRKMGYKGRIVSFEPNPREFAELAAVAEHDPDWEVYEYALGAESSSVGLNVTKLSEMSSLKTPKHLQDLDRVVDVKMVTLDSLFNDLIGDMASPRVFLKIDTQGFDFEVIEGSLQSIERITLLQSELSVEHLYDDVPHYLDCLTHYETLGFSLLNLGIVNRTWDADQTIMEYDCLMLRKQKPETENHSIAETRTDREHPVGAA